MLGDIYAYCYMPPPFHTLLFNRMVAKNTVRAEGGGQLRMTTYLINLSASVLNREEDDLQLEVS